MTTDLSSATIPHFYQELFDICSNNGSPVLSEVYTSMLSHCHLSPSQVENIFNIIGTHSYVNRTHFYKTLALIAWAQQGKTLSDKLFENCISKEYPSPKIDDLVGLKKLKMSIYKEASSTGFDYIDISQMDIINIHLVPEKKGLFLKYSEYVVTSKRFNVKVTRRYNDFVALKELLLNRFPYRLIPSLPPKKITSDAHFLESRRRALQRWLTLVSRHPIVSQDSILQFFLTDQGPDCQYRIRELYKRVPDEFMTSDIAAIAKELLPSDYGQLAANSQNIRMLVNVIGKLKHISEENVDRQNAMGRDLEEFSTQLNILSGLNIEQNQSYMKNWSELQKGLAILSREITSVASKTTQQALTEQNSLCERLGLLLDILVAHKELCDRLDKGLHHDHALALSKLLSMKKRKIQGVIRGTDAESVEHLESKMLMQENVITNMELRSDFSLYCVYKETQLVYTYLGTLSPAINSLLNNNVHSHSEMYNMWKHIQKSVQSHLSEGNVPEPTSLRK